MRRRAGTSGLPAYLARFDEGEWAGKDYGERLSAWLRAWDAYQGSTRNGESTRVRAEQDAWSAYPDEPWDPDAI